MEDDMFKLALYKTQTGDGIFKSLTWRGGKKTQRDKTVGSVVKTYPVQGLVSALPFFQKMKFFILPN